MRHLVEYLSLAFEVIDRRYHSPRDVAPYKARSRKKKLVSFDLRRKVFARDGYACRYCGSRERLEADHVIPEARGGKTTLDNLQTLCQPCNLKKGVRVGRET